MTEEIYAAISVLEDETDATFHQIVSSLIGVCFDEEEAGQILYIREIEGDI